MTLRDRIEKVKPRAKLARAVGISAAYACEIAKGERIGSLRTFVKLADALKLSDREFRAAAREEVDHSAPPEAA